MFVKEVAVEVGLTLSPKQYESVRVHGTVTIALAEGEDEGAALEKARRLAREHVTKEASEVMKEVYER